MKAHILIISLIILFSSCVYDNLEDVADQKVCDTIDVTFSGSVQPILNNYCLECHYDGNELNGVSFSTYESLKASVDSVILLGTVEQKPGFNPMPKGRERLNECDLRVLEIWIEKGMTND